MGRNEYESYLCCNPPLDYERKRKSPPKDFPKLPDLPGKVISPCVTFNNHPQSTKSYEYFREHNEAVGFLDVACKLG